ncbi:glycerate dehydrogenase [Candidatus Aerophobetes bacterium]|uniref:Glycerate dehydrogenase n=1 Tax=Aerophobetes bacterium TaxID=2030807 RepID=A0A523W2R9_UNCAE|nr:MAG: glycerate dehydrogenase [Candidatus Aerophobetes bacterium]
MARIVIPDDSPPQIKGTVALEELEKWGEVELHNERSSSHEEFVEWIKGAQVVVNIRAYSKFSREVLGQSSPSLKLLSVLGTGVDNIDLSAAREYGVLVTNTPGFAAPAVAEHTLALMLAVARQITRLDKEVKNGEWPRGLVQQLFGKTLGIVGLGAIGGRLARIGEGIGMRVIAWTFHPSRERAEKSGVEFVSFDDLFREADVVSVNSRLSDKTTDLVGKRQFDLMKPSAILVNTARGAIVNKKALIDALTSGKIAGVGLDAFHQEPIPPDDPLLKLKIVVLTPHSAGMTPETIERGAQMAVGNVINFLKGSPTNIVR